jgi:hypothetical protein
VPPAESPEVDLGQSLRSALDVGKHRAQKFPVSDGADGVQLLDQARPGLVSRCWTPAMTRPQALRE